ncbi:MAG: histidine kinase, partial [Gammaproteobacteria bacterium]
VNHWQLLERIERAERALDQRMAAAGAHTGIHAALGAAHAAGQEAQPRDEAVEFDPEVAAIFTDEATELIDASERALSDWRSQPDSADFRLGLKRPLHTLKGGARVAGITPMGDLSHELETLVMAVDNGTVAADVAVFDVIQASLDELARMREQVVNGRPVAAARAIIARLQSLSGSAAATAAAIPTPPETPLPAAVAPPAAAPRLAALSPAGAPAAGSDTTMLVRLNAELALSRDEGRAGQADSVYVEPVPAEIADAGPVSDTGLAPALTRERAPELHAEEGLLAPQPVPPGREPVAGGERQEMARVDADLLDQMLNISGEASIARARLEQQLGSFDFNLGELSRTVTRLKEQLRSLEIETEAQILHKHEDEGAHRSEFDPLELDRYSSIQQYSRALAETANDVASIQQLLESLAKDTQTVLQQQARTITELQNGLMRTRMVPFQRHVQRLARATTAAA